MLTDERTGKHQAWHFDGGIVEFTRFLNTNMRATVLRTWPRLMLRTPWYTRSKARVGEVVSILGATAEQLPMVVFGDGRGLPQQAAQAASLPKPIRPGRLRALLHHLLTEQQEAA